MLQRLIPDRIFPTVYDITPKLVKEYQKTAVIFDIDNTLTADSDREPDEKLAEYLSSFSKKGIDVALVSNNNAERVEIFNRSLGLFATPKAGKPKKSALAPALKYFDRPNSQVLFVGDQILTDVMAARRHGLSAFLVKPIRLYENPFFYLKRLLERPFIFAYYRREKKHKSSR